jgi:hypothetical protein
MFRNKLERLSITSLFSLVRCLLFTISCSVCPWLFFAMVSSRSYLSCRLRPYQQIIIRQGLFLYKHTLAYMSIVSVTKKSFFFTANTRGQYHKTFYGCKSRIKLQCLLLASPSSLVHCLWARPGAYPSVEHLKDE